MKIVMLMTSVIVAYTFSQLVNLLFKKKKVVRFLNMLGVPVLIVGYYLLWQLYAGTSMQIVKMLLFGPIFAAFSVLIVKFFVNRKKEFPKN